MSAAGLVLVSLTRRTVKCSPNIAMCWAHSRHSIGVCRINEWRGLLNEFQSSGLDPRG